MPGRATLEGSGLLRTDGELGFAGSLLLAVKQPSGFAAWLAKDVDDAIRRIPAAGFRANVHMTSQRQRFEDLELILGPAKFRGRIDNRQPYDAKPSMQVELTGDALDVDGMLAFTSLFVSEKGVNRLADHDLDFNIKAGPVHVAGLTAETVDTALRLRDRTLEIDRLSIGDLSGATISATGKGQGLSAKSIRQSRRIDPGCGSGAFDIWFGRALSVQCVASANCANEGAPIPDFLRIRRSIWWRALFRAMTAPVTLH